MRRLVCCAWLVCALMASTAHAEPVTLMFTGRFTEVPPALAGAFASGDLAQWQLTYDTEQAPVGSYPDTSIYGQSAFSNWNGSFGSHTLGLSAGSAGPQQWITKYEGSSSTHLNYAVNYYGMNSYFMSGESLGGFRPWAFFSGFDLMGGGGAGLPHTALPFENGAFSLYYRDAGTDRVTQLAGQIDTVVRVPEPTSLMLLAAGALAFVARRRVASLRSPDAS